MKYSSIQILRAKNSNLTVTHFVNKSNVLGGGSGLLSSHLN